MTSSIASKKYKTDYHIIDIPHSAHYLRYVDQFVLFLAEEAYEIVSSESR